MNIHTNNLRFMFKAMPCLTSRVTIYNKPWSAVRNNEYIVLLFTAPYTILESLH